MESLLVLVEGKITGHSPRRMGAQLLATLGVEEATICWFGRWGSNAVKAYLEDARARSRAGKRIWLDAFAAEAAPARQPAAPAPPLEASPLQQRLEGERGAELARVPRVAAVKCFVLNTETRRGCRIIKL